MTRKRSALLAAAAIAAASYSVYGIAQAAAAAGGADAPGTAAGASAAGSANAGTRTAAGMPGTIGPANTPGTISPGTGIPGTAGAIDPPTSVLDPLGTLPGSPPVFNPGTETGATASVLRNGASCPGEGLNSLGNPPGAAGMIAQNDGALAVGPPAGSAIPPPLGGPPGWTLGTGTPCPPAASDTPAPSGSLGGTVGLGTAPGSSALPPITPNG